MSWRRVLGVVVALLCVGERAADAASIPDALLPQLAPLADLDPTNDGEVAPPDLIDDCESKLRAAGVVFSPAELPVKEARGKKPTCGAPQAVVYKRGPLGIRYSSSPIVSCGMALGMARWEQVMNEEAERYLGQKLARIEHLGTYNCRKMARFAWVSEHSYANALDIASVTLKNGRKLTVLGGFGRIDAEPKRPESHFWRAVAHRAYDEDIFSVVVTPFFDALHSNHLHVDQARYRVDGSRPTPPSLDPS